MPTPVMTPTVTVVIDPGTSLADWLTAIGTVGAVLGALVIAALPSLLRWRRRPKLVLGFEEREPYVRFVKTGHDQFLMLRFGVKNVGGSEAHRVRATVTAWYDIAGEDRDKEVKLWAQRDLDPSALRWASLPSAFDVHVLRGERAARARSVPPEVELLPGQEELVELMRLDFNSPTPVHLVVDEPLNRPFSLTSHKNNGPQRISIAVTAANAEGVEGTLAFDIDGGNGYTNVVWGSPPEHAHMMGNWSMLKEFQAQLREQAESAKGTRPESRGDV